MGRDAGWLTAASCLARANGAKGPDFIYLCEVPFSIDTFLKDVKAKLEEQDAVIIAVSEGVKNKDGRYISEEVQSSAVDSFGHSYIAGAAKVLEDAVRNEIGCKVRSIELNLMQRCAAHLASATDIQESRMLGKTACQYALEGATGMMVAVIRTSDKPYATEFKALPVCDIANAIKSVPADYINDAGNDVTEKMVDYLTPLIQGEMNTVYENGIPKYIYLY
jgi:6-phosphofructokinase